MNDKDKIIMDRYLYDVTRRLPEKQKEDIRKELHSLIEDMLEERAGNGKSMQDNLNDVLEELGEPSKLAAKYRGGGEYLIGSSYYPMYCQVLKIVLWCVGVSLAISAVVSWITSYRTPEGIFLDGIIGNIGKGFIDFASIPGALLQNFGAVTLIFFLMERNQVKIDASGEKWKIEKLPQIPCEKAIISRGESLFGMAFGIVFLVLFIWSPEIIGATFKTATGEYMSVSVFNVEIWNKLLPLFIISFTAGIVEDAVKLATGAYTMLAMVTTLITGMISMTATAALFTLYPVWNPNFAKVIEQITGRTFQAEADIMSYWNTSAPTSIVLGIILLCIIINMIATVYKTVRYGLKSSNT